MSNGAIKSLHPGLKTRFYIDGHPLGGIYFNMRTRTSRTSCKEYPYYGGRGIKMCDRWLGPEGFYNFVLDIGPRPTLKHSIDRIDNDGDYCPENCKWSTSHEQCANRRSNNEIVGVSWNRQKGKWDAYIGVAGKKRNLGRFKLYEDAVKSRKEAETNLGIIYITNRT